jgi:hypothetical protein
MANANDIIIAKNAAVKAVDDQIAVTSQLQQGGGGQVDNALNDLMAKKTALENEAVTNLIANPDFDAALKVMQGATKNMNDTAQVMKTVTGVITNVSKFLGFGTDAINAIKSLKKP